MRRSRLLLAAGALTVGALLLLAHSAAAQRYGRGSYGGRNMYSGYPMMDPGYAPYPQIYVYPYFSPYYPPTHYPSYPSSPPGYAPSSNPYTASDYSSQPSSSYSGSSHPSHSTHGYPDSAGYHPSYPSGSYPGYHASSKPDTSKPVAKPMATKSTAPVTVHAQDNSFMPETIHVAEGATVHWVNDGEHPHTVTAVNGAFHAELRPGKSAAVAFSRPGTYHYYCRHHTGMRGTVVVGRGGY